MKHQLTFAVAAVLAAVALAVGGYGLYHLGAERGGATVQATAGAGGAAMKGGDVDPVSGRKVLYWHDPMVPGQRFDAPGKSPFMNMMLVPVYEGSDGGAAVSVDARMQQSLGVRTAEVVRSTLAPRVDAVGSIAFNERDQAVVQTRAAAFLEKVHVRATLDPVEASQPLAELYVPNWVAAQEEFLAVRRMRGADLSVLVDAARQRMRQVGMTDEQIERVETLGEVQARTTLRAPIAGVIVDLAAREGMTVMPGETLFRINGLSTVWANAEVPESQAALVVPGAPAEARSPAIPDTVFKGTVQTILPNVDPATRTLKARVEIKNTDRRLAPGMFVSVAIEGARTSALWVPSEAVIQTGRRTVVMVVGADGSFQPADVEAGIERDDRTEIKRGLVEGQRIVSSGQFLIDSEASLRAATSRMEATPVSQTTPTEHTGEGKIEAIDAANVVISHGPIPSIQWGAMTMQFVLPREGLAPGLEPGRAVKFSFTMGEDGKPRITHLEPLASAPQ